MKKMARQRLFSSRGEKEIAVEARRLEASPQS
jgi:hypothetical protein